MKNLLTALLFSAMTLPRLAQSEILSPSHTYAVLHAKFEEDDRCFYDHDLESDFTVDDERLLQSYRLDKNHNLHLAICAPGAYQDRYIAFISPHGDLTESRPLTFKIPVFDEKASKWQLIESRTISLITLEKEFSRIKLFHRYVGRATCGYSAEYSYEDLFTPAVLLPIKIQANNDCDLEQAPEEWPELNID